MRRARWWCLIRTGREDRLVIAIKARLNMRWWGKVHPHRHAEHPPPLLWHLRTRILRYKIQRMIHAPLAAYAQRGAVALRGELRRWSTVGTDWLAGRKLYRLLVEDPCVIRVAGEGLLDSRDGAGDVGGGQRRDADGKGHFGAERELLSLSLRREWGSLVRCSWRGLRGPWIGASIAVKIWVGELWTLELVSE